MEITSVPKSVRKIVVVKTEPSGVVTTQEIVGARPKRKKQSDFLKPLEKLARKLAEARIISAQSYLALHQKANAKKKNGWARDLLRNKFRAQRRALRKVLD